SRALVEGQPEQAGSIGRIPAANRSLATGLRFPRKLNWQAQRQAGQNRPVALAGLYGDGNANKESAHWPHFRRPSGNFHMRRNAWWWTQSKSNASPLPNSLQTGKRTGNFAKSWLLAPQRIQIVAS